MMIRTIDEAYEELKKRDPGTAISRYMVRQIVTNNNVPSIKSGNKRLVDVDVLEDFIGKVVRGEFRDCLEVCERG